MIKTILKFIGWGILGLFLFIFVLSLFITSDEAEEPAADAQSNEEPIVVTDEDSLRTALIQEMGTDTNRDVQKFPDPANNISLEGRSLYVTAALSDNFSSEGILASGWRDIDTTMKIAQDSGLVDNLTYNGTFSMQDEYGNPLGEEIVMEITFLDGAVTKINTDAFAFAMYSDVATSIYIHPALQDGASAAGLSAADKAACSEMVNALDLLETGQYLASDALAPIIGNGWPNGVPSPEVRDIFDTARTVLALEEELSANAVPMEDYFSAVADLSLKTVSICE
jgi:hypothetical protein